MTTESPAISEAAALQFARVFADLGMGLRRWYLWVTLSWQDIKQRYRRSVLGPFWLTLSMGAMVAGLGFLYSAIFRIDTQEYLPFLCLGLIAWNLIGPLLTEGCQVFIRSEHIIKQVSVPLSVYVYQHVSSHLIVFFHNLVAYLLLALALDLRPGFAALLAIPGLVLITLNGVWASILLGIVSTRFRDIPPVVGSLVQLAFFATPIFWKPELLPGRAIYVDYNPFYHFVELIRAPLLGNPITAQSWTVVLSVTVAGSIVTLWFYSRFRARIAYWL